MPQLKIRCPNCRMALTTAEARCPECGASLENAGECKEEPDTVRIAGYPGLRIGAEEKVLFTSEASIAHLLFGVVWSVLAVLCLILCMFRIPDVLWARLGLGLLFLVCLYRVCRHVSRYFRRERDAYTVLTHKKIYSTGAYRQGFQMKSVEIPVESVVRYKPYGWPGLRCGVRLEVVRDGAARDIYDLRFFSREDYHSFCDAFRPLLDEADKPSA